MCVNPFLTPSEVQFFIEKGLEPGLIQVSSDEEIQSYVSRGFPTLVAHVNKKSAKEYKNYRKAASVFLDFYTLVVVGDAKVEVPMNQVYIYARGETIIYDGSALSQNG